MEKVSTIGKRLTEALDKHNMSQADLCKKIGVSANAVSLYLKDSIYPRPGKLKKMCDILNVSEPWLLGFDDVSDRNNPRLSLEDIRKINRLSKHDIARIMDMSDDEYDYYKDHVGELEISNTLLLSNALNIGINYIKTGF